MTFALQNFDVDLGRKVRTEVPVVQSSVSVRPVVARPELTKTDADWQWNDLRDFVVAQLERRHGSVNRNPLTEAGIFKSYLKRWGTNAPAITRAAFDVYDGVWMGHPMTVNSWCRGSDPFFSRPIAERLRLEV